MSRQDLASWSVAAAAIVAMSGASGLESRAQQPARFATSRGGCCAEPPKEYEIGAGQPAGRGGRGGR